MKTFKLWFVAILLAGCASLVAPQTFSERVAYGYAGITAAYQTTSGLLQRDRITGADAKVIRNTLTCSEELLALARGRGVEAPSCKEPAVVAIVKQLAAGIPTDPNARLALALAVLTTVESYLKAKGA